MVKVFTTNQNGKIEFTKEELETLLNEVWNDGYNRHGNYWWTSPTRTTPNITTPNITTPTITTNICKDSDIIAHTTAEQRIGMNND